MSNDFSVIRLSVMYTPNREGASPVKWGETVYCPSEHGTIDQFKIQRYSEWHRNNGKIEFEIIKGYEGDEAMEVWFRHLCISHDLTFEYSDDGSVWRRGRDSFGRIKAFSTRLPREVAVRIWNEAVDKKIQTPHNEEFHWK